MTAREIMRGMILRMLNSSLMHQGIINMVVLDVSDDYKIARVRYVKDGRVAGEVAMQTLALLPAE